MALEKHINKPEEVVEGTRTAYFRGDTVEVKTYKATLDGAIYLSPDAYPYSVSVTPDSESKTTYVIGDVEADVVEAVKVLQAEQERIAQKWAERKARKAREANNNIKDTSSEVSGSVAVVLPLVLDDQDVDKYVDGLDEDDLALLSGETYEPVKSMEKPVDGTIVDDVVHYHLLNESLEDTELAGDILSPEFYDEDIPLVDALKDDFDDLTAVDNFDDDLVGGDDLDEDFDEDDDWD